MKEVIMENPTPTIQRKRRSDRYLHEAAPAQPATPQEPTPAPSAYQRTPRSARMVQEQTVPCPRALQPSAFIPEEPPPAMERARRPAAAPRKPVHRMPARLTTTIVLLLLLAMALLAAQSLMMAYLTQQEQAKAEAHQAVVDAHPIYYTDLIQRYAEEYNLQPAFVCAIIMNESSFRKDAMSSAGARGLMQLMPDTAEWIAGKLDVEGYHFDRMFDPESNIRFGCWYLNYLSRLFRGDPILIACAYHAGQSNVTSWLSNSAYSQDGLTIPLDKIPMADSKTYAGRVTRDYGIYDALYFHVFNPEAEADGSTAAVRHADDHLAAQR